MKKNKIIGVAVATIGFVVSIGSAIALYTRAADSTSIGISQGTYSGSDGAVNYKINGNNSGTIAPTYLKTDGTNGGTGISPTYTQAQYLFPLSATFGEGVTPQLFVVGNLSVSVTNIPAAWQGKLSIWVDVDGYSDNTIGKTTYEHVFMNSDFAVTSASSSYSDSKDVAVAAAGTQTLRVYLKYDFTDVDPTTLDEGSLGATVSVTWGAASNSFNAAYVVGNGNMWTEDDEYAMAPNIEASSWEWIYNGLSGSMAEAKCRIGDTWSADPNASLDADKVYDVYWGGSGAATFTARSGS